MPLRAVPFAALLLISGLVVGCEGSHETVDGGRPERLVTREVNRFAGEWGPGPGYVANDWKVRFTKDGKVSVDGPGMTARGEYVASGHLAEATYTARDGGKPAGSNLERGTFGLSPDGQELTFLTGLPDDPPVRLVRAK